MNRGSNRAVKYVFGFAGMVRRVLYHSVQTRRQRKLDTGGHCLQGRVDVEVAAVVRMQQEVDAVLEVVLVAAAPHVAGPLRELQQRRLDLVGQLVVLRDLERNPPALVGHPEHRRVHGAESVQDVQVDVLPLPVGTRVSLQLQWGLSIGIAAGSRDSLFDVSLNAHELGDAT